MVIIGQYKVNGLFDMNGKATISADIIKSTSLSGQEISRLQDYLRQFLAIVEKKVPGVWGRLTRGDNLEIVLPNPQASMLVAVMLKCCVKAFTAHTPRVSHASSPYVRFLRYGVRIAIGIGSLRLNDAERGLIDGRAIYNSGRALDGMSSRMRSNVVIVGLGSGRGAIAQALLTLVDVLLTHATAKQCEVLFLRMQGMSEKEIAAHLSVTQVAVNSHLRRAGWYAIENATLAFEEVFR